MEERIYLALLHSVGISQKKLNFIFEKHENYKDFFENLNAQRLAFCGIRKDVIQRILDHKDKVNKDFVEKVLEKRGVQIITIHDDIYPKNLKEISNPPYVFYLRGKLDNSPCIAVVGSRKISSYGEQTIEKVVSPLSKYFTIVSGGAAGCDSKAHRVALEFGGKTISVIGTGIDIDYPVHNKKLYDEIAEKDGAIISIFRIGEVGNPYNFPVRNELVTGLSVGTLVVEAQERSGSLITAQLCLDLGRDLFAIPGDIYKFNSVGCNMLIKKGEAKLTTSALDIMEEYNFSSDINLREEKISFTNEIEKKIYNLISVESLNANQISKKMKLDIHTTLKHLSGLEIQGFIKSTLGGKYQIS